MFGQLHTTARKDVSATELRLRKLDRRDMALKAYIAIMMTFMAATVLWLAVDNRTNIIMHRNQVEDVITRTEASDKKASEQLRVAAITNKARGDVNLCINSVSESKRTPAYIKECYDRVEKSSGVKLERYGDGV